MPTRSNILIANVERHNAGVLLRVVVSTCASRVDGGRGREVHYDLDQPSRRANIAQLVDRSFSKGLLRPLIFRAVTGDVGTCVVKGSQVLTARNTPRECRLSTIANRFDASPAFDCVLEPPMLQPGMHRFVNKGRSDVGGTGVWSQNELRVKSDQTRRMNPCAENSGIFSKDQHSVGKRLNASQVSWSVQTKQRERIAALLLERGAFIAQRQKNPNITAAECVAL